MPKRLMTMTLRMKWEASGACETRMNPLGMMTEKALAAPTKLSRTRAVAQPQIQMAMRQSGTITPKSRMKGAQPRSGKTERSMKG